MPHLHSHLCCFQSHSSSLFLCVGRSSIFNGTKKAVTKTPRNRDRKQKSKDNGVLYFPPTHILFSSEVRKVAKLEAIFPIFQSSPPLAFKVAIQHKNLHQPQIHSFSFQLTHPAAHNTASTKPISQLHFQYNPPARTPFHYTLQHPKVSQHFILWSSYSRSQNIFTAICWLYTEKAYRLQSRLTWTGLLNNMLNCVSVCIQ